MGVGFSYTSLELVSPKAKAAILDEAEVDSGRLWLVTEGICFFDVDHPDLKGKLVGSSKISPQAEEIAANPDAEKDDFDYIVRQLEKWSAEHGVDWELSVEGGTLGFVREGKRDDQLATALEGLSVFAELDMEELMGDLGLDDLDMDDLEMDDLK